MKLLDSYSVESFEHVLLLIVSLGTRIKEDDSLNAGERRPARPCACRECVLRDSRQKRKGARFKSTVASGKPSGVHKF